MGKGVNQMKKFLILGLALSLVLMGTMAAGATIRNSAHDLSTTSTNGGIKSDESQVCIFCHTPHNPRVNVPLWNRQASTAANYTLYQNPASLNNVPAAFGGNSSVSSALCLSCHDGTISLAAYINDKSGGTATMSDSRTPAHVDVVTGKLISPSTALIGTDLSNDHPVNMPYDSTQDTTLVPNANLDTTKVRLFGGATPTTGTVQCGSCHNVHEPGTTGEGTYPFLRSTNTGSALCFACHAK